MLATNQSTYQSLLPGDAIADSTKFWNNAFNDPNKFKKMYKQDIIYDILEKEKDKSVDQIRRV